MIYEYRKGSAVSPPVAAEDTYHELVCIGKRRGGLTSRTLADDVEEKGCIHPLGWAFTFDEDTGMRKLHEIEAGNLIRLVVVREIVPEQTAAVRALVLVSDDSERCYEPIHLVLKEVTKRQQVLADARKEWEKFQHKMDELLQLCALL